MIAKKENKEYMEQIYKHIYYKFPYLQISNKIFYTYPLWHILWSTKLVAYVIYSRTELFCKMFTSWLVELTKSMFS